jgi:hypothetical protein
MIWVRMLAYITGTVDQELLPRNSCSEAVRYAALGSMGTSW